MCCLVTDGGGALIMTTADRAKDFPTKPVYLLGTGESRSRPRWSARWRTFHLVRVPSAYPVAKAFEEAGITHKDVDHLMIYDAFAHLPIYGLEDLGFMQTHGEAASVHLPIGNTSDRQQTAVEHKRRRPFSYMHSGMYGMYALQESVRQMRGTAPAQVPGAKLSVCHGVGGMFGASGTIIFTNEK